MKRSEKKSTFSKTFFYVSGIKHFTTHAPDWHEAQCRASSGDARLFWSGLINTLRKALEATVSRGTVSCDKVFTSPAHTEAG